jgi:hypothetical protein
MDFEFVISVRAHHGSHDGTRAGAGDHLGQQALFVQRLGHADMKQPQRGAAGEHECRLTKTALSVFKESDLCR